MKLIFLVFLISFSFVSCKKKAEKYSGMQEISPDIKNEVKEIFGVDDKVVIQFTSPGTVITEQGKINNSRKRLI